jgi:hypothetical protein
MTGPDVECALQFGDGAGELQDAVAGYKDAPAKVESVLP